MELKAGATTSSTVNFPYMRLLATVLWLGFATTDIPGTCVQYPGPQSGGAPGVALTPGTPAGNMAASTHGGTYSHVAGRGRHPAAQRTCAQRAGRPTRRTCGRVGSTAARRGASNPTVRCCQQPPTRRRNRSRRAGTITLGSSWAVQTPQDAARGRRGAVGGGRGAAAARALWPLWQDSPSSHVTLFAFSVIAIFHTDTPSDP